MEEEGGGKEKGERAGEEDGVGEEGEVEGFEGEGDLGSFLSSLFSLLLGDEMASRCSEWLSEVGINCAEERAAVDGELGAK